MHCRRVGNSALLVVLAKDEKVVANLLQAAADNGIEGGWVQGLGSVKDAEMGYYELHTRTYIRRTFKDDVELIGLNGNLAMAGTERVLHVHCSVSGPDLAAFAGHLFEARVAVTAEFLLQDFGLRVERAMVPEVGLRLIQPAAAGTEKAAPAARAGGDSARKPSARRRKAGA